MADTPSRPQILLAWLALIVGCVLMSLALLRYGLSVEAHVRLWRDILDRPGGPMSFRFVLQPLMAAIAAYHDGARDARAGRPAYLSALITGAADRGALVSEALISTARIVLLGFAMDGIYQATVLKTFYPGEMLVIAVALAFVPYLLLRGAFTRLLHERAIRRDPGKTS